MAEERTMHVDVTSEMIGKYVFLPGSVERASLIAKHFDNPVKRSTSHYPVDNRESQVYRCTVIEPRVGDYLQQNQPNDPVSV